MTMMIMKRSHHVLLNALAKQYNIYRINIYFEFKIHNHDMFNNMTNYS